MANIISLSLLYAHHVLSSSHQQLGAMSPPPGKFRLGLCSFDNQWISNILVSAEAWKEAWKFPLSPFLSSEFSMKSVQNPSRDESLPWGIQDIAILLLTIRCCLPEEVTVILLLHNRSLQNIWSGSKTVTFACSYISTCAELGITSWCYTLCHLGKLDWGLKDSHKLAKLCVRTGACYVWFFRLGSKCECPKSVPMEAIIRFHMTGWSCQNLFCFTLFYWHVSNSQRPT